MHAYVYMPGATQAAHHDCQIKVHSATKQIPLRQDFLYGLVALWR